MVQDFVLFDDVRNKKAFCLNKLCYVESFSVKDLALVDEALSLGMARGLFLALFADYEWGAALQGVPVREEGFLYFYWFSERFVVDNVEDFLKTHAIDAPSGLCDFRFSDDFLAYERAIQKIHEAILRGDVYQVNFTMRLFVKAYGSPLALYQRLRQPVAYAVLACLKGRYVLSFSPELFLALTPSGEIYSEPMKGTAPILGDGEDEARKCFLESDEKNRAENVMIVDLLRNDLGQIAKTASVRVDGLLQVKDYGTVWQMVSCIRADLREGLGFSDVLLASFPCGSITGAPKLKSMEYIFDLENEKRGLYTGAIGFLECDLNAPLKVSGVLNVAIRTLCLEEKEGAFAGVYGVGSGVVIDSEAKAEYEECFWKSAFLRALVPEFSLFETMRFQGEGVLLWQAHKDRLLQAADRLGFLCSEDDLEGFYKALCADLYGGDWRVRLMLSPDGSLERSHAPYQAPLFNYVALADDVLPKRDFLRRFKTTHRVFLDQIWQDAERMGAFDALLFNEEGWLLEGGRSAVMIREGANYFVPSLDLDILPSIARKEMIKRFAAKEALIDRTRLKAADAVYLGNALHGVFEVVLLDL